MRARALSLFMFIFMSIVSLVVFFTQDQLDPVDHLLMIGAPLGMATVGYFVGLHHDPRSSD